MSAFRTTTTNANEIYTQTTDSLNSVWNEIITAIPNIIGAILVLLVWRGIAWLVKKWVVKVLNLAKLWNLSEKTWIRRALDKAWVTKSLAQIIGAIIFWIILLAFINVAFNALGLEAVSASISELISYIPNVIAAVLILLAWAFIADFLRDLVVASASRANLGYESVLWKIAYVVVLVFAWVIALSQIGIDASLLQSNIIILLGWLVWILVLWVGLGSKDFFANMIASQSLKSSMKVGDKVSVGNHSGTIKQITNTMLVLDKNGETVHVPAQEVLSHQAKS